MPVSFFARSLYPPSLADPAFFSFIVPPKRRMFLRLFPSDFILHHSAAKVQQKFGIHKTFTGKIKFI